jgi:hypothetical protein
MEWMQWNFPDVYAQVKKVRKQPIKDYKSADYASQHPTMTGRTP